MEEGIIEIHGKQYQTVAYRVTRFWEKHPEYRIKTKIMTCNDKLVMIKATILDNTGIVIATGTSEERRDVGKINAMSAVENCETSAVGRALAFLGIGGTHIRSAEEMEAALQQQEEQAAVDKLLHHNAVARDHIESIVDVKVYLMNGEYGLAYEAIAEIPQEDAKALWLATSKGGLWSPQERQQMKSDEWAAARKQHHGENG